MHIILETEITDEIKQKYILLELDSFRFTADSQPVTAYCLVEQLDLNELLVMQQYLDLHGNLMSQYRNRHWDYVEQAIQHLLGRWNNQLDSFYRDLLTRVHLLRDQTLDQSWDGVIDRSTAYLIK